MNLYEAFLQRGPDAGGLGFWTSLAASGSNNCQNVLNAFATCSSFRKLAGTLVVLSYETAFTSGRASEQFAWLISQNEARLYSYSININVPNP